ncbi:helix-turn-helix transcriptional regulator [Rhodobacter ferrooxidans]|uniref:helix-turn-helix transcriptional regulator n=1 Tax=Rhodobacter ferrooxidans TaxID=371731 RepID=UPI000593D92D|nr:helix-turn-helix transcriptional regulator [Rhodobacter sp. SW2]
MAHELTGSRIRDKRLQRAMRQSELAELAGISATYLSLIERNRRSIGGKLLNQIARALAVEPVSLTEGAEGALIDRLRTAAAGHPEQACEVARIEDFAAGFPGWAALVGEQARKIAQLEVRVAELNDRIAHDPELASALHQVISAVTSIQSAASILVSGDEIDDIWQARFKANIHADSLRLAESSKSLVGFLEAPAESGGILRSPQEEVDQVLETLGHHLPALEGKSGMAAVAEVVAQAPGPISAAAQVLLGGWLKRYRHDALAMPLATFSAAALQHRHNPTLLARAFDTDLAAVLRRLAALPSDAGHPSMGLAICDGSGALTHLQRVAGFALPHTGAACSLWPLFQVLTQPGLPVRTVVSLPGNRGGRFLCYAVAQPRTQPGFDEPPVYEATMLVVPDLPVSAAAPAPRPIGTSCRICPRPACPARREPTILS